MTTELRLRNQSQQQYVRALSQALRWGPQLWDPSLWLVREPELEEKMLRDADIAHAVGFRQHLIAGRRWNLVPRNENSPRADMAVFVGTELLSSIKKFTESRRALSRAFFSGSRFGRIHGRKRKSALGDGKVRTWWVPERIEDIDKRQYRIVPDHDPDAGRLSAHWERWNIARSMWEPETETDALFTIRHVYNDTQNTIGHGQALREALAWVWYAKTQIFQEYLSAIEKHAGGTFRAKVAGLKDAKTSLPNSSIHQEWIDKLEDMRARHVVVHDKDDEIDVLPQGKEGNDIFAEALDRTKSMVFTLVLGANLTTSAEKGGSYALAEIQENSTEALIQYDRECMSETLTDDLMACVWHRNYANLRELHLERDMPRFTITQEKRNEPLERAQVFQALNQIGVNLSLADIYEQCGAEKPVEGEDVLEGASQQPAIPGFPGGNGGGFPQFDQP